MSANAEHPFASLPPSGSQPRHELRRQPWRLHAAAEALERGGVIAYPTESVFGLGCDPFNHDAVMRLLAIKQRSVAMGLICVASDLDQLLPLIARPDDDQRRRLAESWPGPRTWLIPVRRDTPWWLSGAHPTLACRVSAHPLVRQLCEQFGGAIVSTSANRHGQTPAHSARQCHIRFKQQVDVILPGYANATPTAIHSLIDGRQIR